MANPLQPKVIKCLEQEFNAYVIKITAASKAGAGDVVACIAGDFYMFEVKWASDVPSELQKQKINQCIAAGGRAYFVRSVDELRTIVRTKKVPETYRCDVHFKL